MSLALEQGTMEGRLTSWELVRAFVLAGNATFTLRSVKTGERFTYKVRKAKNEENQARWGESWFVSLLRGPDNEGDYAYMGVVDKTGFHLTKNSRVGVDAKSHKAFAWFFSKLNDAGELPEALEFWHEGKCGRCGRKLTVPESVATGIGPVCDGREA